VSALKEHLLSEDIKRPQRPAKRAQPAREEPASAPDPGGHLAIGLMIGIVAIIGLLTLAIVISIP